MGGQRSPESMGTHPLKPQQVAGLTQRLVYRSGADVLPGGPLPNLLKVIAAVALALNAVLLHRGPSSWGSGEQIPRVGQLRLSDRHYGRC